MSEKFSIIDAHEDIAFHLNYFKRDFVNPEMPCMITLPALKKGNVRMVFNTVFIHPKHKPDSTIQSGLDQLSTYEEIYDKFSDDVYQIRDIETREEVLKIQLLEWFFWLGGQTGKLRCS